MSLPFFKHILAPTLVLLAGFVLAGLIENFPQNVLFVFAYLPYFFFGVSILLCVQFNQSRMFFALLNIVAVYAVLQSLQFSILRLYEFVLVFWALINIAGLMFLPERSILSTHSLVKITIMVVQGLFSWYLLLYRFLFTENLMYSTFWGDPPIWLNFSWLMAIVAGISLLAASVRYFLQPTPIFAAMLILVFLLISFMSNACEQSFVIATSLSAGVLAFLAVLFDSHQMAYRDELTGLRSRRALNQYLTGLGRKYTIAMMDIDHFKKFNDNHGHDIGDQMLKLVASKIARVSGGGTPFRYGGEEFTVVFPRKSLDDVMDHLEDLRDSIEGYPLIVRSQDRPKKKPKEKKKANQKPKTLSCTISIGLASRGGELRTPEEVIKGADEALYRAKKKGRNCVSV